MVREGWDDVAVYVLACSMHTHLRQLLAKGRHELRLCRLSDALHHQVADNTVKMLLRVAPEALLLPLGDIPRPRLHL